MYTNRQTHTQRGEAGRGIERKTEGDKERERKRGRDIERSRN